MIIVVIAACLLVFGSALRYARDDYRQRNQKSIPLPLDTQHRHPVGFSHKVNH